MPRSKTTRNPLGSILKKAVLVNGKKAVRWDARKRYTRPDGTVGEKTKRCMSQTSANAALINFSREIQREMAGETGPKLRTFFHLCEYFEREYVKAPVYVGDKKYAGYRQDLTTLRTYINQFKEFFGNIDVTKLNYQDIRAYS